MSTFCGVLKLSRRIRDPVMTMAPLLAAWPSAFVVVPVGGVCALSCAFCGVVSRGAAACEYAGDAASAVSEMVDRISAFRENITVPSPADRAEKYRRVVEDRALKKKRLERQFAEFRKPVTLMPHD